MANQGAKKRKEENARHISNLLRVIIACNVVYILVRMIIYHSSFTWKHWIGLIMTSLAYVIPYKQLASMAKPAYTNDGELIDGGFDMSTGGICGFPLASRLDRNTPHHHPLLIPTNHPQPHPNPLRQLRIYIKYQDLQFIKHQVTSKDSCHMIPRERRRTKRPEKSGKNWKGRLRGPNLVKQGRGRPVKVMECRDSD
ncbi:hypothetical protein KSS87_009239 [Heliosperma pusillum]|nr:hypothetical protein KSS87_009239 [Heliosperma pusillum]